MNTEISPETTRTCSKGHDKSANNNSFTDLAEITGHGRNNIRLQCLELSNNKIKNLSWQTKAWHESTNCIEQKSLTDHEPKRNRKYDGTHVNIASYMTDSDLVKITAHGRNNDK